MPIIHGKLGRNKSPHDSRTLRLRSYMRPNLPPLPAETIWRKAVAGRWGMMLNDRIGCCDVACMAHLAMLWSFNQGRQLVPSDQQVLQAYSDLSGYNPYTGANDNGVNMLQGMRYWRTRGVAGHTIDAFAAVHPQDHDAVAESIYLLGGIPTGIMLPKCWQGADVWDLVDPSLSGNAKPNSWGPHAILGADFTIDGVWVITWGQEVLVTWRAWDVYVEECYAAVSQDWVSKSMLAPNRFDYGGLMVDLKELAQAA